ncbi:MAG: GNAT family N-acetyltransferase [Arcicella sp.]|jgi:RimJ/RimL family protein N-acetyltransferase|nr:GNAT family N-acetyltransferase [Arcicella sp.]
MIEIFSQRLRLIPLDNHLLTIWNTEGRKSLTTKLGLNSSDWNIDEFYLAETEDALQNFWLPMTAQHEIDFFWYTNWEIILDATNTSIGGIGFAGFPDQDGVTMVGYFIDGNHRELGYATEALNCLIDWAKLEPTLKTIIADTPFFNLPSQNVLKKAGFKEFAISETEHLNQKMQLKNWKLVIR